MTIEIPNYPKVKYEAHMQVPNQVQELINHPDLRQYKEYSISRGHNRPKRNIQAPCDGLKEAQQWLLKKVLYRRFGWMCVHPACKGFMPNKSAKDAVMPHIAHNYILELDIKDFFPSITEDLVAKFLRQVSMPNFIPHLTHDDIIKLICYKGHLPQGAPTSPFVSNLVMIDADALIQKVAIDFGMVYTRYADDIVLSANWDGAGTRNEAKETLRLVESKVQEILSNYDLTLNSRKSKIVRPHQRQKILGIVVNEKLSVPRWIRKRIRARLHRCGQHLIEIKKMPAELVGLLAYVKSINEEQWEVLVDHHTKHLAIARKSGILGYINRAARRRGQQTNSLTMEI